MKAVLVKGVFQTPLKVIGKIKEGLIRQDFDMVHTYVEALEEGFKEELAFEMSNLSDDEGYFGKEV